MNQPDRPVFGGRYELFRRIARGGMAEVFLARDRMLDRPVAVKVLFPEYATDPSFVERFRREAQAAANLSHPNVVGIFDWGEESGTYFIVMEYVEGKSLAEIVRSDGPLAPERAAEITADIAAALGIAHRNGVVHRDVKPGNVLITEEGEIKVTDFGIARAISANPADSLTQTGSVMGTATYLSPEQAQGNPADPRSDIYSLSVVLYEMLTSGPPFTGDTPVAVAYKHVQEEPRPPREYNADIPAALEAITMRGLAKNPDNRYATAEEFRNELKRFVNGESVLASSPPPSTAAPPKEARPAEPVAQSSAPPAPAAAASASATDVTTVQPRQARPTRQAAGPPPGTHVMYAPPPNGDSPLRTVMVVLGLLLLLVLLGVVVFLFFRALGDASDGSAPVAPDAITVPLVEGLPWEEAQQTLVDAGFAVENIKVEFPENGDVEEGIVFDQNPRSGLIADPGAAITLLASGGLDVLTVPPVIGQPLAGAQSLLSDFEVEIVEQNDDQVEAGIVLDQIPPAGAERPPGSTIQLIVSSGRILLEIPDIAGFELGDARVELARVGFENDDVVEEFSDEFPADTVIRTDPPALSSHPVDALIQIFVSKGPESAVIPEPISDDPAQVEAQLLDLGFGVVFGQVLSPPGDPLIGRVVSLEPPPGEERFLGTEIKINVGFEDPTQATTTTTTTTTTTAPPTTTTQPTTTTTTEGSS